MAGKDVRSGLIQKNPVHLLDRECIVLCVHPQFIIPLLAAREADAKQLAVPGSPQEDSPPDKRHTLKNHGSGHRNA
jgi:hypothetical protein